MRFSPTVLVAAASAAALLSAGSARAGTVSLSSTMVPTGYISESQATGAFGMIGRTPDGLYDINAVNTPLSTPLSPMGSPVTLFPNGTAFNVGSVTYNEAGLTGVGTEVRPIQSLNTAPFWAEGSATTDVSDQGLYLWFFDGVTTYTFGGLDAADTVTFTNGKLSSVNLSTTLTFAAQTSFGNLSFDGTFSVAGNAINFAIADTDVIPFIGQTTFTTALGGTVNAVPEPTSLGLVGVGGLVLLRRRRRRRRRA